MVSACLPACFMPSCLPALYHATLIAPTPSISPLFCFYIQYLPSIPSICLSPPVSLLSFLYPHCTNSFIPPSMHYLPSILSMYLSRPSLFPRHAITHSSPQRLLQLDALIESIHSPLIFQFALPFCNSHTLHPSLYPSYLPALNLISTDSLPRFTLPASTLFSTSTLHPSIFYSTSTYYASILHPTITFLASLTVHHSTFLLQLTLHRHYP